MVSYRNFRPAFSSSSHVKVTLSSCFHSVLSTISESVLLLLQVSLGYLHLQTCAYLCIDRVLPCRLKASH